MAQIPCTSSACRSRLLVSPLGAKAYMVAVGSVLWASPRVWPASCVTVFCTSYSTQPTWGPPGAHRGPSAVVNANPESFSSMSASRISPVAVLEVVVVVAMALEYQDRPGELSQTPRRRQPDPGPRLQGCVRDSWRRPRLARGEGRHLARRGLRRYWAAPAPSNDASTA